LGVSAHSYVGGYRFYNTKLLDSYIDYMQSGKSAVYSKEYVSKAERRTERIMLSLRTVDGLDLKRFKKDFEEDLLISRAPQINKYRELGMLDIKDDMLFVTEKYFYVSNSLILELV